MDQPGNNHLLLRISQSPPAAYNGQHAAADRMRELLARTVHDHLIEERSMAGALESGVSFTWGTAVEFAAGSLVACLNHFGSMYSRKPS